MVYLGDYFFNKSHKGIFKRASKRQLVEETQIKEGHDQMIVHNFSNTDSKKAVVDMVSALSTFAGANSITINELNVAVDNYKAHIYLLED